MSMNLTERERLLIHTAINQAVKQIGFDIEMDRLMIQLYERQNRSLLRQEYAALREKLLPAPPEQTIEQVPIKPQYYRCGICECLHPINWNGDCRDDANRFASDQLDKKHGGFGWEEVEMPT